MSSPFTPPPDRRPLLINAIDMFAPSHVSFGQWRRPEDEGATKRRDLGYWIHLAQTLERGNITALILADVLGQHDIFRGSSETAVRTACQYPAGDPSVPVSAMAAVTRNLGFIVSSSTSYEPPFLLARRASTLDHLTNGRFGWNIGTACEKPSAKAFGLSPAPDEKRYSIADDYLTVLYKLWEGSWADDALNEDVVNEIYSDPVRIQPVDHDSPYFSVQAPHILDPSPQRTPFLMHTDTPASAVAFAAKHAEAISISALSAHLLAPRIKALRTAAAHYGRDPHSLKVFATITPIIGRTDAEAQAKFARAMEYASIEAGLAFYSAAANVDAGRFDMDEEIKPDAAAEKERQKKHTCTGNAAAIPTASTGGPKWTPRNIGKLMAVGGHSAVPVGSASRVADAMEEWLRIADVDGFNIGAVVTPGSFEDLVDLLIPELRSRGLYPNEIQSGTVRERVYGFGQRQLREDHIGKKYTYEKLHSEGFGDGDDTVCHNRHITP